MRITLRLDLAHIRRGKVIKKNYLNNGRDEF